MNTKNELPSPEHLTERAEARENSTPEAVERKRFVEPEVSAPIDVLEATTFFQGATSGTVTVGTP